MESARDQELEPFGRQPQPVEVHLKGHSIDIDYWLHALMRRAESHGDMAQKTSDSSFKIYPRAVND